MTLGSWRPLAALAICGVAVVIPGCSCSFSVGSDETTVKRSDEVSYMNKYMTTQLPDLPPAQSVDCPGDVALKVDTTYDCQATLTDGQEVTVPFRVASVDGNNGTARADASQVIQALAVEIIYRAADSPPKSIDCPTGVPAQQGKTFDCRATAQNGKTATITLEVKKATMRGQDLKVTRVRPD